MSELDDDYVSDDATMMYFDGRPPEIIMSPAPPVNDLQSDGRRFDNFEYVLADTQRMVWDLRKELESAKSSIAVLKVALFVYLILNAILVSALF